MLFWVCFCAFFRIFFTSTLNSSASPWLNLEQACCTATTYSLTGGFLGLMTNFGPRSIASLVLLLEVCQIGSLPIYWYLRSCYLYLCVFPCLSGHLSFAAKLQTSASVYALLCCAGTI